MAARSEQSRIRVDLEGHFSALSPSSVLNSMLVTNLASSLAR